MTVRQNAPEDVPGDGSTRERVEEVATSCFAELGYHAASMQTMADKAEMRPASFYHWFPSKQALLQAIMRRSVEGLTREVAAAIEERSTPADRLASAAWTHVVHHGSHRDEAFVADTEIRALEGEGSEQILQIRKDYEQMIRQIIEEGVAEGAFRCSDTNVATKAILLMCTGITAWFRPDGTKTLAEIAQSHVELVLRSLGADAPAEDTDHAVGDRLPTVARPDRAATGQGIVPRPGDQNGGGEKGVAASIRLRMGPSNARYGGGLVDGATIASLFGDLATEVVIRHDGDEGLFRAYETLEFLAPVRVGDYIEARAHLVDAGTTSRRIAFEAWKQIETTPDVDDAAARVLGEPALVARALGTVVVPRERQRGPDYKRSGNDSAA